VGASVPLVLIILDAEDPAGARCPRDSRRDAGATWPRRADFPYDE